MRSKSSTTSNSTATSINKKKNRTKLLEGGGLMVDEFLGRQAAFKGEVKIKTDVHVKVQVKPPPAAVKTIRELIYWEYAKLIAKAAGFEKIIDS